MQKYLTTEALTAQRLHGEDKKFLPLIDANECKKE